MAAASDQLPDDVDTLKAALIEARAKLSGAQALIEHLQLVIAKLKREMFGPRSEHSQRLIDQLELQLEELAAAAGEEEAKAARVQVQSFTRRQATRRNFPADLPRGGLFTPRRARVRAAAAANSRRSGRMSPRRSMSSRGNGS
jgi:transposase